MRPFNGRGLAVLFGFALAASLARPGAAQIRLPSVTLPSVPLGAVGQGTNLAENSLGGDLSRVRILRVQALVRANRRDIDTDRNGAAVVRGMVLSIAPSEAALAQARADGFEIMADRTFAELDLRVVTLRAPEHTGTPAAIDRLRKQDPAGSYEYDHLFDTGGRGLGAARFIGTAQGAAGNQVAPAGPGAPGDPAASQRENGSGADSSAALPRVGLIDTGIDAAHPAFRQATIHAWGCDGHPVPSDHGTAVASLLVGHSPPFAGVLPQGELYAADVYCGRPTGGAADAIVAAIAWLAAQQVGVINMSLVGPANLLLARAVQSAQARGHIIVAAVGNDGPAAAPLYPAAYPGVIGVTAVDAHRKILLEACRGPHVSFAAPGADMEGADANGKYHALRGTSYAAPIVAGLLARGFRSADSAAISARVDELARTAVDLGNPGKDPVFGYGLVGSEFRVPPGSVTQ